MDLPGNSQFPKPTPTPPTTEPRPEPHKVEKVVSGTVTRKGKGVGHRLAKTFFGDTAKGVGVYVFMEVIIPALKDLIVDSIQQGTERTFYGDSRPRSRVGYRGTSSGSYTSYNNRYGTPTTVTPVRQEPRAGVANRARAPEPDDILIERRIEAEEVLSRMRDILQRYESVSLAELYGLVGITGDYTHQKWGWRRLDHADVTRDRGGMYRLVLPPLELLD